MEATVLNPTNGHSSPNISLYLPKCLYLDPSNTLKTLKGYQQHETKTTNEGGTPTRWMVDDHMKDIHWVLSLPFNHVCCRGVASRPSMQHHHLSFDLPLEQCQYYLDAMMSTTFHHTDTTHLRVWSITTSTQSMTFIAPPPVP